MTKLVYLPEQGQLVADHSQFSGTSALHLPSCRSGRPDVTNGKSPL